MVCGVAMSLLRHMALRSPETKGVLVQAGLIQVCVCKKPWCAVWLCHCCGTWRCVVLRPRGYWCRLALFGCVCTCVSYAVVCGVSYAMVCGVALSLLWHMALRSPETKEVWCRLALFRVERMCVYVCLALPLFSTYHLLELRGCRLILQGSGYLLVDLLACGFACGYSCGFACLWICLWTYLWSGSKSIVPSL